MGSTLHRHIMMTPFAFSLQVGTRNAQQQADPFVRADPLAQADPFADLLELSFSRASKQASDTAPVARGTPTSVARFLAAVWCLGFGRCWMLCVSCIGKLYARLAICWCPDRCTSDD